MKIICSECGKDMGEEKPFHITAITNALCPQCVIKKRIITSIKMKQIDEELKKHKEARKAKIILFVVVTLIILCVIFLISVLL